MQSLIIFVLTVLIASAYSYPAQDFNWEEQNQRIIFPEDDWEPVQILYRQRREPQHGSLEVNAARDRFGTDVGARLNNNVWQSRDGRSQLNAEANYNRHFGGPGGTGRPNYGVGLNFNHRF